MGQKEVKNENCCGVFEMRDLARFFSEVLKLAISMFNLVNDDEYELIDLFDKMIENESKSDGSE